MPAGYYRDYDAWLYATAAGAVYLVADADTGPEPAWRDAGAEGLGDDAERVDPDAEDMALFERARLAYGIPA
jgi:hypothetical protein